MNLSAMVYPDTFIINGESFRGKRNAKENGNGANLLI